MIAAPASIEIMGCLPHKLDKMLADFLRPSLGSALNDSMAKTLRAEISYRIAPDYEKYWAAFTYLYFSSNFLKAYLTANAISKNITKNKISILDLGCGSGASIAGFLCALNDLSIPVEDVTGIDMSKSQLKVFDLVTAPWMQQQFKTKVKTFELDMFEYCNNNTTKPDIVLLSYSLSELCPEKRVILVDLLETKFARNGAIVVVLDSDQLGRGLDVEIIGKSKFLIPYDNVLFQCSAIESLDLNEKPKFTEAKTAQTLANHYFEAWRTHNINLLKEIFCEECIYQINSHRTLTGIGELYTYWKHNASTQAEVGTNFCILSEMKNRIIVKWRADFIRTDTNDRRLLDGVMFFELESGKIRRLEEYYSQRRIDIRAPLH